MRVAAVIPWRGGKPDRERHHAAVRDHLRQLLPDAEHIDADNLAEPFSRAGSRNHGVRLAEQAGCDVVVICDADTLVEEPPLRQAIAACADGVLHLPYTRYRSLTRRGLAQHNSGTPLLDCEADHDHEWATGGVLVTQPAAWWRAGGMDERFRAWGHEDVALRCAADTLCGETVRHPGVIHHLWHPTEMGLGTPDNLANAAICERYNQATGDVEAMRLLVAEHNSLRSVPHAQLA